MLLSLMNKVFRQLLNIVGLDRLIQRCCHNLNRETNMIHALMPNLQEVNESNELEFVVAKFHKVCFSISSHKKS